MDDTSDGAPPLGFDHKGERAKVERYGTQSRCDSACRRGKDVNKVFCHESVLSDN